MEHDDPVRSSHRREPVSDDQGGPPPHEPLERLANQVLALGVEGRGGLVQDQNARILEDEERRVLELVR